jgi:hypothetical protein
MKKISIKGLFAGVIVHHLVNGILLALPIIYVLLPLQSQEVDFEKLGNVFLNAVEGSANLPLLQTLAGFVSAVAAGYAAGRIAGRSELLNGTLAVLPGSAFAAYRLMARPDGMVAGVDFVLVAAALLCALFGGFLAAARNRGCTQTQ